MRDSESSASRNNNIQRREAIAPITAKMASEELPKSAKASQEALAVISNRLAIAMAKREALVKSWTASSSRPLPPTKTQAELDAEDAALFRNEPPHLGVGAPIPAHFLVSEAERGNKSLRAKFFPTKGLKASKARDAEEKAASVKRAKREESSDEEEGRSSLGRAKKLNSRKVEAVKQSAKEVLSDAESEDRGRSQVGSQKKRKIEDKSTSLVPVVGKTGSSKESQVVQKKDQQAASSKPIDRKQDIDTDALRAMDVVDSQLDNRAERSADVGVTSTVTMDAGEEARGTEVLDTKAGMDSKERKRLKKKEKKKRRKLREAEPGSKIEE